MSIFDEFDNEVSLSHVKEMKFNDIEAMAVSPTSDNDSEVDEIAEAVIDLKETVATQQQQIAELNSKQARALPVVQHDRPQFPCLLQFACTTFAQSRAEHEITSLKSTMTALQATVTALAVSKPITDTIEVKDEETKPFITPTKPQASRLARAAAKRTADLATDQEPTAGRPKRATTAKSSSE